MSRRAKWILALLGVVLLVAVAGQHWLVEIPLYLIFGWITYVRRVGGEVLFDWPMILISMLMVIVFTTGLHVFLCWLVSNLQTTNQDERADGVAAPHFDWRPRWTVAIVAMVFMLFVAGIGFVGIVHHMTWLARSPVPILEGGVGEAERRNQSMSQLKHMAIAAHDFADNHETFPAGSSVDAKGKALHGWQTALLPYLEEGDLHLSIQLDLPWHHAANFSAFAMQVFTFLSPQSERSGLPDHDEAGYALTDYAANRHVIGGKRPMRLSEIEDGTSRTLLQGEAMQRRTPWGRPDNSRDPALGINTSPDGFGADWASGGAIFSFGDGHAMFIQQDIDPAVLKALATPAGGEMRW